MSDDEVLKITDPIVLQRILLGFQAPRLRGICKSLGIYHSNHTRSWMIEEITAKMEAR